MKTATLTLLEEIVERRFGFITADDMVTLLSDSTLHHADVLLRFEEGRKVVKLSEVAETITAEESHGCHLRDVAFTARQCAIFREHA